MTSLNAVNNVVSVVGVGVGVAGVVDAVGAVGVFGVLFAAVSSRPSGLLRVFPFTHLTIMEAELLHTRQCRPQGQYLDVGKGITR